jgi:hypothetical protein
MILPEAQGSNINGRRVPALTGRNADRARNAVVDGSLRLSRTTVVFIRHPLGVSLALLFPHFPPALLDTTSTLTRLTHTSVFYRRLINVRDHTPSPSPGLSNLTTLHAFASLRPPLAQRTRKRSFPLPPTRCPSAFTFNFRRFYCALFLSDA